MKNLFALIALLAFAATSMFAQKAPKMEFEQTTVDYGTIEYDSNPLRTFTFKNTGNSPLVITGARGSCGCTVPTYPKKPIAPGETAVIEVRYDTKRPGVFRKSVSITTNEKVMKKTKNDKGEVVEQEEAQTHILYIKGDVTQVKEAPAGTPTKKKSIIEK